MSRPGHGEGRITARSITAAPKPEFKPYVWRGDDSPVIGRPAPHVKRDEPEEDGEQCPQCLRYAYDPHYDQCMICGFQLHPEQD